MKLFICFDHYDKDTTLEVVNIVCNRHDVWLDDRLYYDQNHWEVIEEHIAWCDAFLYVLSPASVRNDRCSREFGLALELNKIIFSILSDTKTALPPPLEPSMCIDFSRQNTSNNVKALLDAVHKAELQLKGNKSKQTPSSIIADILTTVDQILVEEDDYESAHNFLLGAIARGIESRSLRLLAERLAELLEEQIYDQDMRSEYGYIVELINREQTRQAGLKYFQSFNELYPRYDPVGLQGLYERQLVDLSKDYVFISYSHEDKHIMLEVLEILKRHGYKFWVDTENLAKWSNSAWTMTIERAIKEATCVVVLLSPDAKKSRWIDREVAYAQNFNKEIIPALMLGSPSSSVSLRLISYQLVQPDANGYIEGNLIAMIKNAFDSR